MSPFTSHDRRQPQMLNLEELSRVHSKVYDAYKEVLGENRNGALQVELEAVIKLTNNLLQRCYSSTF